MIMLCLPKSANHGVVPDMSVPSTPSLTQQRGEDEIMELLLQNNPSVGVCPLDRWSFTKPPPSNSLDTVITPVSQSQPQDPSSGVANSNLFMADDEMAAWLHYPIDEFYSEPMLPNPALEASPKQTPGISAPVQQLSTAAAAAPERRTSFPLFSRMVGNNNLPALERLRSGFTVVGSSDTPPISDNNNTRPGQNAEASAVAPSCPPGETVAVSTAVAPGVGENITVGECGVQEGGSASPSSSSATNSPTATVSTTAAGARAKSDDVVYRKRKAREVDELVTAATTGIGSKPDNEELEGDSDEEKKSLSRGGSTAKKRTRAAEVHNLSERRRRDRINEKMRALQELIPRCNKTDKASMLDDAIEYLKSLQMQVQMMSMGCGMMPPMMYPGMQQQCMPPISMGMDMGMPRLMMPYPSAIPAAMATVHVPALPAPCQTIMPPTAPRLSIPPLAMPSAQPSNLADTISNPYAFQIPATAHFPNINDPYHQQFLAYQQMLMQMKMQGAQSQTPTQPVSSKPARSTSEGDNKEDAE